MITFIIYLIGYILFGIGYFIWIAFTNDNYCKYSKKYWIYQSCKYGVFSWVGIIFMLAFAITYFVISFNDWIEEKLK